MRTVSCVFSRFLLCSSTSWGLDGRRIVAWLHHPTTAGHHGGLWAPNIILGSWSRRRRNIVARRRAAEIDAPGSVWKRRGQ